MRILTNEFEILRKNFGFESVQDFLDHSKILDCQAPEKSQKILLEFIKNILANEFAYDIENCGNKEIKIWIYFDDVLASGGTFRHNIEDEIINYGSEEFKNSGIKIIASFFIVHTWAKKNVTFTLSRKFDFQFDDRIKYYAVAKIENDPIINYYNSNPKFNHVYPIESEIGLEYLKYLEGAYERDYELRNEKFAFRNPKYPNIEEFYSSPDNRNRYEQIILKKGIEIIHKIDNSQAQSLRPLGMTLPSNKTLGTGSHFFTWRNISNTCPIIFWWEANGWYPLFPVKNRG